MNSKIFYRYRSAILAFVVISTSLAGCTLLAQESTATATPSSIPQASPEATNASAAPTPEPVIDKNVLYHDDFTKPATGWPDEKFDNYFIGYHEPEYYHVAITSPNYKTTVFIPEKPTFTDASIESDVQTFSKKTATTGDFRYGIVFRRSADQYYAFTISPRTKKWYVLKSSPDKLSILKEGTEAKINDLDVNDKLRVDAKGSTFSFLINDKLVGEVSDSEYASGEVGFYVQTLDAASVHIHFDSLTIRNFEASQPVAATPPPSAVLYKDDFTKPSTGWLEKKFDNYFIGYHEPESYHVAITSQNYKTTVFVPDKPIFTDTTIEMEVNTFSKKTAATGDFRYGVVFRRSGDQYYAFTISPRTKKWYILKSSADGLTVLKEGDEANINDLDVNDILRVDAQGSSFFFHINDDFVGQAEDADYASGEVGLYVQTLDAASVHIHFDSLTIRNFEPRLVCTIKALRINVRSGPGTSYSSSSHLDKNVKIEPIGQSSDGKWISIKAEGLDKSGWISTSENFVSCNSPLNLLPVLNP